MPRLSIDGREVNVPGGTTVIQAAEKLGIFIPRYCYHPGLSIAGNCRICLVEVEKTLKLQIACNMPVSEGMVVHTKSDKAEAGRRAVLEFLLANHPLDCPVCDQSGECDLQNFYMNFGLYDPRFREQKVKKKKAVALGPHVSDFRFKARVWYLSSAPTVCSGCSQGCNVDLHYVLNRPHLNDGARVVRIKPRYNRNVNQWWMCDEGRYGFGWVDRARLVKVRGPSTGTSSTGETTWEEALTAIAAALGPARDGKRDRAEIPPGRAGCGEVGVIASARLTNEDLFLIREIFQRALGARVTATVPEEPGSSDDFLIKADKNPNTMGASLLGLAGGEAPAAGQLVDDAIDGKLDVLWVFGHDLVTLFGEDRVRKLAEKVPHLIYSGTNQNPTAGLAHWVLPSAAYVEKDGTFVNCHGWVQRIGRAFPPLGDSREDWRILLDLIGKLGLPLGVFPSHPPRGGADWRGPEDIFLALAGAEASFAGLSYETIGAQGAGLAAVKPAAGSAAS